MFGRNRGLRNPDSRFWELILARKSRTLAVLFDMLSEHWLYRAPRGARRNNCSGILPKLQSGVAWLTAVLYANLWP